jgi:hypothetical protein
MLVDVRTLRNELSAVNTEATALCERLTGDQLAWRLHPAKWSIAENLIHLCPTTELFLPAVDHAIMADLAGIAGPTAADLDLAVAGEAVFESSTVSLSASARSYCIGCPGASTPLAVPHGWISALTRPALTVGSSCVNLAVRSVPTRKMATARSSP